MVLIFINTAHISQAQKSKSKRKSNSSKVYRPKKKRTVAIPVTSFGREYHRGPRGGCYYINSKGKKVYVDHSYCN